MRPSRFDPKLPLALVPSVLVFPASACGQQEPPTVDDLEARARAIHGRVITIDTHDDISPNFATPESDPGQREGRQVTLPKMREGGLDVAFFIVYVGQTERTPENYEAAKERAAAMFDAVHRLTDEMYPDEIGFAWTPDDVERLHAEGKLAATIGIENGLLDRRRTCRCWKTTTRGAPGTSDSPTSGTTTSPIRRFRERTWATPRKSTVASASSGRRRSPRRTGSG